MQLPMVLREYERKVLALLVPMGLVAKQTLDSVEFVSLEHTGNGYFLTVKHPALPLAPLTCHEPFVVGRDRSLAVGFVAYLGERELLLECHGLGDPVPQDVRERDLAVSVA